MNNNESNEYSALMEKFNAGNVEAFDYIFKSFYIHLTFFAYKIIHDIEDSKDITMVVLEYVFDHHKNFTNFKGLKTYLYIAVKNRCLKWISKQKKFVGEEFEEKETDNYAEAQIVKSEFLREIYQQIECLTALQKQVFKMFYIDDMTISQIAKALNTTASCVYSNKCRALKQLRIFLNVKT